MRTIFLYPYGANTENFDFISLFFSLDFYFIFSSNFAEIIRILLLPKKTSVTIDRGEYLFFVYNNVTCSLSSFVTWCYKRKKRGKKNDSPILRISFTHNLGPGYTGVSAKFEEKINPNIKIHTRRYGIARVCAVSLRNSSVYYIRTVWIWRIPILGFSFGKYVSVEKFY